MDRWDSLSPLLPGDDGSLKFDEESAHSGALIDEDNSSGYDSTEISDTESPSTNDITANPQTSGHVVLQEVLKFRSPHALCESLKLILQVPEMCDVMFLVGPREMPVFGVRAILSARSSVFYRLILRHLQAESGGPAKRKTTTGNCRFPLGHLVIPVRKYNAEVFRMLIHFVHCGSATVTEDTVAGLLCGAMQFELPDLAGACWEFVTGVCWRGARTDFSRPRDVTPITRRHRRYSIRYTALKMARKLPGVHVRNQLSRLCWYQGHQYDTRPPWKVHLPRNGHHDQRKIVCHG